MSNARHMIQVLVSECPTFHPETRQRFMPTRDLCTSTGPVHVMDYDLSTNVKTNYSNYMCG